MSKPLDQIITSDADLIISVRDISELRQSWKEHPLVQDLGDATTTELFNGIFGSDDENGAGFARFLEDFELTLDQFFELFPDQATLVVYNLSDLILQQTEQLDLAVIANFSGSAERLDQLMQIQFERNAKAQKEENPRMEHEMVVEKFMGETLNFDEAFDGENTYIEDGYALVDGYFILASPEERLRSIVESIKDGSELSISKSSAYQRVLEDTASPDGMFFANMESLMPPLNEALKSASMAGGMAMFGFSSQSLESALNLNSLEAFSVTFKIEEDALTASSALIYKEKVGLLELLTYEEGALPSAEYVPQGVLSSSVASFNLSEMFARIEALLGVASPSIPALLNMQYQQLQNQTGVDFRSAFMQNFERGIVNFSLLPKGVASADAITQADEVYVLEIKDSAALSGAVEALKDVIPGARAQITTRDFQGETIHNLALPADPLSPDASSRVFSFAVTRSHLICSVGQDGLIHRVIAAMQSQDAGFWQSETIELLVDRFGKPGAVTRFYADFGEVSQAMFKYMSQLSQLSGGSFVPDSAKLPSLPWHIFSETHEASDGLYSRMILLRKEDL
ncbi:MAG: hypothetical protein ACPGSB_08295 [Opitutales bacterium]